MLLRYVRHSNFIRFGSVRFGLKLFRFGSVRFLIFKKSIGSVRFGLKLFRFDSVRFEKNTNRSHHWCVHIDQQQYTLKKIGALQNPHKRFWRFQKASKGVQSFKKRIKKSTKPLMVLTVCPG